MFSERKILWLVYTVLFGMVPIIMRLIAFAMVNGGKIAPFSSSDFISLGIVLHVSLLAESRYNVDHEVTWTKAVTGISVFAIVVYAAIYIFSLLADVVSDINISFVFWASVLMVGGSLLMSLIVYDRLTYSPAKSQEVAA